MGRVSLSRDLWRKLKSGAALGGIWKVAVTKINDMDFFTFLRPFLRRVSKGVATLPCMDFSRLGFIVIYMVHQPQFVSTINNQPFENTR